MTGWMGKTTTDLNMRKGADVSQELICVLPQGTFFDILEKTGEWYRIQASEQEGFVYQSYVQLPKAAKTTVELGVLESPGATTPTVVALYEDTQVMTFDKVNDWHEVIALGEHGFVSSDSLAFPDIGRTTGEVNLRAGPSTDNKILEVLPPGTQIHIWKDLGTWVYIADTIRSGYLHKDFVQKGGEIPPVIGNTPINPGDTTPTAPEDADKITLSASPSALERQVATIWNRVGGLLRTLSAQLAIDPAVAVAVLSVESGGRAFDANGRTIIRFENHIFYDRWGKQNEARFNQFFTFASGQRWTGHSWRSDPSQPWQACHGSQDAEWATFNFACTLDDTAAKLSISMGGPQIMGFNYATLGYASVQEMFDAFAKSEREQIIGFFNFIKGRHATSARITALQTLDFTSFARSYNGPGQAEHYGNLIRGVYDAFHRLKP
ncbi:MAG: DUF3380 domain-containing protein [Anaerolineae bacterium]|nr:DUF3380 domain-containing protein [Anaerolineae bacterium]